MKPLVALQHYLVLIYLMQKVGGMLIWKLTIYYQLTQEQLADKIYVSRQTVSKWQRGESLPDLENIIILSDLYVISIDQLLRGAKFLI